MTQSSALLRQARSRSDQTQRAVAARAGIAQPTIAAIESGRRDATVSTISRLVEATGCQLGLLPTLAPSTAAVAAVIQHELRDGNEPTAFRHVIQLSDDLLAAEPALAVRRS